MTTVTRILAAAATWATLLLSAATAQAQGVYPGPEALPNLRVEVSGSVNVIIPYLDGGNQFYLLAGNFEQVNGATRNNLARVDANGALSDGALGAAWLAGTNAPVLAMELSGDEIYIGGEFTSAGGRSRSRVARFSLATGALDAGFAPTASDVVRAIQVDSVGGVVYLGGSFQNINAGARNLVAKVDTSGALLGWNAQVQGTVVYALHFDSANNRLYIGGQLRRIGGSTRRALGAVVASTGALSSWNPGIGPQGGSRVHVITADATHVYAGGLIKRIGSATRNNLAKFSKADASVDAWNPNVNGRVLALALDGAGSLYLGGDFSMVGGSGRLRMAKVNASVPPTLSAWQADADRQVTGMAVDATGRVLAGGTFSSVKGLGIPGLARLAAANGDPDVGFAATSGGPGSVSGFAQDALGGWIVGGSFDGVRIGAAPAFFPRANLLRLNADFTLDQTWTASTFGDVRDVAIDGNALFVGGSFTSVQAGIARNRLARFDLAPGTAAPTLNGWNPNADNVVERVLVDAGQVYVAGQFGSVGGSSRSFVARLDAATGIAGAWNPDPDAQVNAVLPDGAGGVYLGGSFTSIIGSTRVGLAHVNDTTGAANAGFVADVEGSVSALQLDAVNGRLYVGGTFTEVGVFNGGSGNVEGTARENLARVATFDGAVDAAWDPWSPTLGGAVSTLAHDAVNDALYVGGQFAEAGGVVRDNLARVTAGTIEAAWYPGADRQVAKVQVLPGATPSVLAAGAFTTITGVDRSGIALIGSDRRDLTEIQNLSIAPSGPNAAIGQSYTISFTVANLDAPATIPVGSLSVTSVSGDESLSCAVVSYNGATGAGSCTLVSQFAGAHTVTVTFTGDPEFMDAEVSTAYSVLQATTTLTLSTLSPSALGQSVTAQLNLAATSVGAAPTGNITVEARNLASTVVATCNVAAVVGASSCQLSGVLFSDLIGDYTVAAAYAGDANYVGDTSNVVPHSVVPFSTTITLVSHVPTSTTVNENYVATVAVTASDANTPTGSVTVSDQTGATCTIDAVAFAGGDRDCDMPSLSPGSKTLLASFNGTGNYGGSNNSAQLASETAHPVGQAATTLALGLDKSTAVVGESITATVTFAAVPAGSVVPQGSISVTGCAAPIAIASLDINGQGSCTLTATVPGTLNVSASYAGDANFTGSSAGPESVNVSQAATTLGLALSWSGQPSAPVFGQQITATVTFAVTAPGGGTPSGNIVVSACAAPIAIASLDINGQGSCSFVPGAVGPINVSASYAGDANYSGSSAGPIGVTVAQAATSLAVALSWSGQPAAPVFGQQLTATVTFGVTAPGAGTPSGNIAVSGCAAPIAIASLVGGQGSCTLTAGAAGVVQNVTATYAGDVNFAGSNGSTSVTPAKANTSFTSFNGAQLSGEPGVVLTFTWSVAAVAPGAGTPTGTVQVSVDGTGAAPQCSAPVGAGTCDITFPAQGTFALRAVYAGDANFNTSQSAGTLSVTITSATADLQISKVVSRSRFDTTVPSEEVEFMVVAANVGPASVVGASLTDALPAGLVNAVWTCTPDDAGASCSQPSGTGNVNITVDLAPNTSVTLMLQADVENAPFPGITNTATIAVPAGVGDPVPGNNSSSAFYQRCLPNRGATLTGHFCTFRDGFEAPPSP